MNVQAISAVILLSISVYNPALAQNEAAAIASAQESSTAWLALMDVGKYEGTWNHASSIFKKAITKENWQQAAKSTRNPLGKVEGRILKNSTFTRNLPGLPDGEYVVLQYQTKFINKANAIETVTPTLEKDGTWKISGYFVK